MQTTEQLPPVSAAPSGVPRAPVVLLTPDQVENLNVIACEVESIAEQIRAAARAGKPRAAVSIAITALQSARLRASEILYGR